MRRILVFVLLFCLSSCWFDAVQFNSEKSDFNKVETEIKWASILTTENFVSPWDSRTFGKTTFQYTNDKDWLYFLFVVKDEDIVFNTDETNKELGVLEADRVELFFAVDSLMQTYYTFEMGVSGNLFDAKCFLKNNGNKATKVVDSNWDIPKNVLHFTSTIMPKGYKVEGKLSTNFLNEMNLIEDNKINCAILRANFYSQSKPQWICHKNPKLDRPEFHCWEVFEQLHLK